MDYQQYQLFPPLTEEEYEALKADIKLRGVQVPVEKDDQGNTLDGFHRERICRELGITDYPVLVRVGMTHEQKIEQALNLNLLRRHLTPEQRAEVVLKLRQEGWSMPRIADKLQVSQGTVHADLATFQNRKVELPERTIGKDGKSRPARLPTLLTARQAEARLFEPEPIIEAPALPSDRYRCIVIDPPWPVQKIEREARPNQGKALDYPTMHLDEIMALPLRTLVDLAGCHIYLWATHKFLPYAFALFTAWDIHYQCMLTWVKPSGMTPYSWMYNTEHVLFGRVGNLQLERMGLKLSFEAPTTGHSAKPDVFYERVMQASPGPRLEMFARKSREGFEVWGNEVVADAV